MAELLEIILSEIRHHGPITFERFMELALYHPQSGYYMREKPPFGPDGDFYTSAHLPLFGETLALQIEELLEQTSWHSITIIELGPGMGYTASGILTRLSHSGLIDRVKYILVEPNPHLKGLQEENLKEFSNRCSWQKIEEIHPVSGIIIANEVLDALPVHIVEFHKGQFHEVYVTEEKGKLIEKLGPLSSERLAEYIKRYSVPQIESYRTEISLMAEEFLIQLASVLKEGLVLLIDYGYSAREYYCPERTRGTLLCYHQHRTDEDVLESPGHKDITAHVNFSAIKDWAIKAGLKPLGYTSQGSYLVGLGIDRLIEERLSKEPTFARKIPALKGLIFDMGDTHQVMALCKGIDSLSLRGFSLSNRLERL